MSEFLAPVREGWGYLVVFLVLLASVFFMFGWERSRRRHPQSSVPSNLTAIILLAAAAALFLWAGPLPRSFPAG